MAKSKRSHKKCYYKHKGRYLTGAQLRAAKRKK